MKTKWKLIFAGAAGIILLFITIFSLTQGLEADLLEVKAQTIANTFQEEGKVIPQIEFPIYALNNQEILKLPAKEGKEVKQGDVLAVLDTKELDFQLKQLQGQLASTKGEQAKALLEQYEALIKSHELQLEQAQLELTAAETSLHRTEELYNAGAITKIELEEAQRASETARINFEQQQDALQVLRKSHSPSGGTTQFYAGKVVAIEAQVEQLQYQIEKSTILAPVSGTIADLEVKKGELTQAGMPIMTIFQKDAYLVEVFVLAEDVQSIEKDMEVRLIQDRKDKDITFPGTVKEISPSAVEKISALGLEEQRVKVIIGLSPSDNAKLFPELRLDVEFTTDKRENQLVVPKTVLFPDKEGYALWVVKNGKAKVQSVETGFETDRFIVIEKGLDEGDLVIINPQLEGLKDGKKIK